MQEFAVIGSFLVLVWMVIRAVRARRWWDRLAFGGLTLLAVAVLIASGVWFWYYHRPRPDDTQRLLFQGIEYIRDVREDPRPNIIHVVKIDLDAPGLSFLVTPSSTGDPILQAQTTGHFLETYDLQLAINGDFFDPFRSVSPFDYYPRVDDPVSPRGLAASRGSVYTTGTTSAWAHQTLYISEDNRASFQRPGEIYNAISGWMFIVQNGAANVPNPRRFSDYINGLHPRTAIGLDAAEETLILVLVDGRQPNYSEGVSVLELAEILIEYGAYTAMNMDGGGSTALVIENGNGDARALNSPIDNRIPGRQRAVANHLGVYAAVGGG